MPSLAILIAPLLALYLKFRLAQFALKIIIFTSIYLVFKNGMEWSISVIMSKIGVINFPCMVTFVLNSLDVFSMINFALSFYASVFIGRFTYNALLRFI